VLNLKIYGFNQRYLNSDYCAIMPAIFTLPNLHSLTLNGDGTIINQNELQLIGNIENYAVKEVEWKFEQKILDRIENVFSNRIFLE
jgi:hypothetical protein